MKYGLQKYRLNYGSRYDPDNVIGYIVKIIINIQKTLVNKNFSYSLQKRIEVSSPTMKRWQKTEKISDKPSINEIEKVKSEMELNKKHRLEMHYTQNQLIKQIQTDQSFKKYIQDHNKSINRYSRTSLRNKIHFLIKNNIIKCKQVNGVNHFEINDVKDILIELMKITK